MSKLTVSIDICGEEKQAIAEIKVFKDEKIVADIKISGDIKARVDSRAKEIASFWLR